ncbi:MAG: hypothetical protein KDI36_12210 [Pseudomonadales bacterium]|nr:hypothetical protein [Pseudomonadales bacterium]
MHKLTFTERRSGVDRRQHQRRHWQRRLRDFFMLRGDRRASSRRGFWLKRGTYTVYDSDRL